MTPPVAVRRATTDDAEAIGRLFVEAWQAAYRGQMPDDYLDSLDRVRRGRRLREVIVQGNGTFLVAESSGVVVAACRMAPCRDTDLAGERVGEITAIYVAPPHWRRSYGTALLASATAAARAAGYEALTLWVLASNSPARAFYEARGFLPDGAEKTDHQFGIPLLEVRYRAMLTGG